MKKKLKDVISKEFKGLWGTDFSDDGIPVIKTNNMTYEGRIDFSDICIRNIPYKEAENNFLKKGDLIIEKSGGTKTHSVGYVNIFEGEDDKYVCNNFILPLRPNTKLVFPKYLFWQLHGMYEAGRFSDCYNKTTGIQNLQKKTYFSKDINLPSKEEQIKIAVHLDKIQSAIDNKKQQLSLLDEAVKSEFVEMFGENPVESGKWKVENVGTLSTEVKYGTSSPAVENGKYKYLRMNNITTTGYLDLNDLKYINISDEEYEKCVVRKGDIVFNRTNSREHVGKTCLYDLDEEMIIAGYLIRVRLNNSVNPRFFSEFMNIPYMKLVLRKTARGAVNQSNINSQELKRLKIPIPPLDLQNQFAAFVQQIDKSKFVVKQQITDLQELLDSKMQEYFS